jgi:hypothetical protein
MAQATLPGLLSVLRPVVVPTRSCRLHRLTPHCERADSDESGLPRRSARGLRKRTLSSWYVPDGEMVQPGPDLPARPP